MIRNEKSAPQHPLQSLSKQNSEQLFERAQAIAPGGVHSPVRAFKSVGGTPIFFKAAEGPHLISVEGDRYIDFCQSFGPLILGHRDPEVAAVVNETMHMAWSFGTCEPYSLLLGEWITQRVPWVEKLRFVNSGTEAVMSALRLARAFTGRSKVLKFVGCYHGHVDSLLVRAGSGLAGQAASDSAGVSQAFAGETLVAPLDFEEEFVRIFATHGKEVAAVIIEPLPANFGLLPQRREFLHSLVSLAKNHGSLVIFDEVISGFRVATGGMSELLGLRPDLVTYGKVMGGGFPVGCYGGREDIMDKVAPAGPVYQAGTLSANPVGMTAGLATLEKVERERVYSVLETRTKMFIDGLNAEFARHEVPLRGVREGSVFWFHHNQPGVSSPRRIEQIPKQQSSFFQNWFHACLKNGVYLAPSGYEVGFVSYAHTEEVLQEASEKMLAAARACLSGVFK